jgi:hypothetical protein
MHEPDEKIEVLEMEVCFAVIARDRSIGVTIDDLLPRS